MKTKLNELPLEFPTLLLTRRSYGMTLPELVDQVVEVVQHTCAR